MRLVLGGVWRKKTSPRCVRIVGATAGGGVLVRACKPDGTLRSPKTGRRSVMWERDFHNFICLKVCELRATPEEWECKR